MPASSAASSVLPFSASSSGRRPSACQIFFCCHEPVWPLSGGGTSGNLAILHELKAAGLDPVAVMPYNASLLDARRAIGVRFYPFRPFQMHRSAPHRTLRYALFSFLYLFALLRGIRRMNPGLLICRNSVLALPVYLAAKLAGVPSVIALADFLSFYFWSKPARPPLWHRLLQSLRVPPGGAPRQDLCGDSHHGGGDHQACGRRGPVENLCDSRGNSRTLSFGWAMKISQRPRIFGGRFVVRRLWRCFTERWSFITACAKLFVSFRYCWRRLRTFTF